MCPEDFPGILVSNLRGGGALLGVSAILAGVLAVRYRSEQAQDVFPCLRIEPFWSVF
jgi:hypothetical protein